MTCEIIGKGSAITNNINDLRDLIRKYDGPSFILYFLNDNGIQSLKFEIVYSGNNRLAHVNCNMQRVIINGTVICIDSKVHNSDISDSLLIRSDIKDSRIKKSDIINSRINNGYIDKSSIKYSIFSGSTSKSKISHSNVDIKKNNVIIDYNYLKDKDSIKNKISEISFIAITGFYILLNYLHNKFNEIIRRI